jgi:hypothetical protein
MLRLLMLLVVLALPAHAQQGACPEGSYPTQGSCDWPTPNQEQVYVTIVVKACPFNANQIEPGHPAASGAQGIPNGYIPKPEDWNGEGEPESARMHGKTKEERAAMFADLGCIDVPIPPEVIQAELTMKMCAGKIGYLISMQYLEQNQTIEQKAVGEWACIPSRFPVAGVSSF